MCLTNKPVLIQEKISYITQKQLGHYNPSRGDRTPQGPNQSGEVYATHDLSLHYGA